MKTTLNKSIIIPNKIAALIALFIIFSSVKVFSQETTQPDTKSILGKWERNYKEVVACKDILWIEEYNNQVSARLKIIGKDDNGEEYISYPKWINTFVKDNKIWFCFERSRYYPDEGFELPTGTYYMVINVEYWAVERQGRALNADITRKAFFYKSKNDTWLDIEDVVWRGSVLFYPEGDDW